MGTPKGKRTKMDGLPQINPDAAGIDVGNAQHWVAVSPDRDPANGNYPLNFLSQSKGALQTVPPIPIVRRTAIFDCAASSEAGEKFPRIEPVVFARAAHTSAILASIP